MAINGYSTPTRALKLEPDYQMQLCIQLKATPFFGGGGGDLSYRQQIQSTRSKHRLKGAINLTGICDRFYNYRNGLNAKPMCSVCLSLLKRICLPLKSVFQFSTFTWKMSTSRSILRFSKSLSSVKVEILFVPKKKKSLISSADFHLDVFVSQISSCDLPNNSPYSSEQYEFLRHTYSPLLVCI